MSEHLPAKRNDRVAPPQRPGGYVARFLNNEAAKGWEELCRAATSNTWDAWVVLTERPRSSENLGRQHRLKGEYSHHIIDGDKLEQWQYEVTSGGRIWYVIDEENSTVWIARAGTGHPKLTD